MRRRVATVLVLLMAFASIVFAGGNGLALFSAVPVEEHPTAVEPQATNSQANDDYVYMKSDEGWQMEHNGRKIMVVVGNFAAYHNGTVITADSAVRYSERHIECFGKVLINRGTTYIYGDRAEYNGNTNIAKVYSKIIKVVDGDATLYTYNFTFNTKRNVGHYTGGGVLICRENMLESDRGYLYTEKDELVCVDRVQMRNDDYEMTGDSVVYNTETGDAQFFTRTNIWNKGKNGEEDDYIYADRGAFVKAQQLYKLTKNGYILTKDQEMLSDSLDYYRDSNYVLLRRNIQIDDRSQKMLVFGDWGEYWKEPGNVFVTKRPSLISYDTSESDSVFVCSDSLYLYTRYPIREKIEQARKDSLAAAKKAAEAKKSKDATKAEKGANVAKSAKDAKDAKATKDAKAESANDEKRPKAERASKGAKPEGLEAQNSRRDELMRRQEAKRKAESAAKADSLKSANAVAEGGKGATPQGAVATDSTKVATDTLKVETKSRAELRRAMIDSLANDTTKVGMKLRAKLLKEEAAEANRAAKAAIKRQMEEREAARRVVLAEREALYQKLLAEAKVRDAERERIEKAEAKRVKDSLKLVAKLAPDTTKVDSLKRDSVKVDSIKRDSVKVDSVKVDSVKRDSIKVDSVKVDSVKVDSTKVDTLAKFDTMTVKQVKAYFKAIYDKERAEEERIKQDSLEAKLDRIGRERQQKRAEQYRKWAERDSIYMAKSKARSDSLLSRKYARLERRGIFVKIADSLTLAQADSVLMIIYGPLDKQVNHNLDSMLEVLYPKPVVSPTEIAKADSMNLDSLYREIHALGRVKLFRSDIQSVCDSLTTSTLDSIINMYKAPVLWSGDNQITAEKMHIHTKNQQLVKAIFDGKPLMAAEIDTAHYNQVAGKEMIALFRDNKVYRNDVNGNVQTIYFMQEDNSPEITLMAYIEAGDMTSYIEDQTVVGITYRGNPAYTFYPIDKIPATQPTKLQEFKWEALRRPTQDSIFTRTIRPSLREKKRALRKPSFPLNALLEQRKKDYTRRREWRDRNDVLSYETKEWIRTLR